MKVFAFEALGEMPEEAAKQVNPEDTGLTEKALESLAIFLSWFAKED